MGSAIRKVRIDECLFLAVFGGEFDSQDIYPQSVQLDLETGELLWVYDEDQDAEMMTGIPPEENAAVRRRVDACPERYLEVPEPDHGEHHEILREFLYSDWTDDADVRRRAQRAYSGSIGKWKRAVNDEAVVHAYHDFCERAIKDRAEEFLREHGVEAQWT